MKKNNYKIILVIVITLVITVLALRQTVAQPYRISGDCMEPAVADGQLCFLNKISPYLQQYQIGDIVAFKHEGRVWFSRVVALENNTIKITEGSIIVNGAALQDAVVHSWSNWKQGVHAINKTLQVPPDHVFVLSDKLSADHDDSRVFGPVSTGSIMGFLWGCF